MRAGPLRSSRLQRRNSLSRVASLARTSSLLIRWRGWNPMGRSHWSGGVFGSCTHVPTTPAKIIFWPFRDPDRVVDDIRLAGFLPRASSAAVPAVALHLAAFNY